MCVRVCLRGHSFHPVVYVCLSVFACMRADLCACVRVRVSQDAVLVAHTDELCLPGPHGKALCALMGKTTAECRRRLAYLLLMAQTHTLA